MGYAAVGGTSPGDGFIAGFNTGGLVPASPGSALNSRGYATYTSLVGPHEAVAGAFTALDNKVFWRGGGGGGAQGGFEIYVDFALISIPSTFKLLMGLTFAGVAIGTSEPSNRADVFLLAADSTDTNLQIMHARASPCTKIDLGADFPKADGTYVRLTLSCAGSGAFISYRVHRFDASVPDAVGTPVLDVPSDTEQMFWGWQFSTGVTAVTATVGFVQARAKVLALP